ncbi:MAG: hypothetical protein ABL999_05365 [Pyrinomonadaceae bacterium]
MKILNKFRRTVVIAFAATLFLIAAQADVSATPMSFDIIHPNDAGERTGMTYGEWSVAWWQHVFEIPFENNPIFDPTGASRNFGQTGPVFFLVNTASGSAIRNACRVPAGKALFFPPLTISGFTHKNEPEHSLRNYNRSFINSTREIQVSIDDVDVGTMVSLEPHSTPLRAASADGFFSVIAPENNIFGGVPGQSYETVSDGFYLMVAPLPPGPHTIKFGGVSRNFAADVTYNLVVESEEATQVSRRRKRR